MSGRKQRLHPEKDATNHILSSIDKPIFEERFIDPYKGRGVFARVPIEKGCFLLEYRGELISKQECSARQNKYSDREKSYLFDFQWNGGYWCLDASKEDGSLGRLVNDDHRLPNGRMRKILVQGKPHLCLFAINDIAAGSEITYNYGHCNWPWRALCEKVPSPLPDPVSNMPVKTHESLVSGPPENVQVASSLLDPSNSTAADYRTSVSEVDRPPDTMEEQVPSPLPDPVSNVPVKTHESLVSGPPENVQVASSLLDPSNSTAADYRTSVTEVDRPPDTMEEQVPSPLPDPVSNVPVKTHESLVSGPPENVQVASSLLDPSNSTAADYRTSVSEVDRPPDTMEEQVPSPLPDPVSNVPVKTHESLVSGPPENVQVAGSTFTHKSTSYLHRNQSARAPVAELVSPVQVLSDPDISDETHSGYSDKDYVPDTEKESDSSDSSSLSKENINPMVRKVARIAPRIVKARKSETSSCVSSEPIHSANPTKKSIVYVAPMPKRSLTRAKFGRYNKKQYCFYCKKPRSKLARHLEHVHSREPDVAKAFSFDKKSAERRVLLRILTSRGNFAHNAEVSGTGSGEMVARRRPIKEKTAEDYKHCIHCQGMYARETLWRHMKYCPLKSEDGEPQVGKKRVQSLPYLSLPPPEDISKAVWNIACEMNNDEIASVVRSERYILLLGQHMYNKSKSVAGRNEYVRQKMREVARLVIRARSVSPLKNMQDFIMPCNFRYVINAVRSVAAYDEERNLFGIGSLAVKLGHSLKKIANIIECNALMIGDSKVAESARNFSTLYEKKWNESISASALNTLTQAKWNKPQVLPFTEDVKKLHSFLASKQEKAMSALLREPSYRNFTDLSKLTLTQVILFNRRREGEVSKLLMKSYASRDQTQMHKDIAVGLSDFEKKLCEYFQRIEICGKRGRKVPVLLAPHMVAALDLLVEKRESCGVPKENEYLFARPAALSHYRGADCFREYAKACGAENPGALSSTKLRKQVATLSTVLNLKENELDQLAGFLGHDIRVHREFYRLPESTLELAKVSKILIAMEKGKLPELQGKGLDGVNIEPQDELDMSSGGSSDEEESVGQCQTQNKIIQGFSSVLHAMDDNLNDGSCEDDESADLPTVHSRRTPGVARKRSKKRQRHTESPESRPQESTSHICKKPNANANERRKWESAEVQAVERHLLDFIRQCKVPGKRECVSCLMAEPVALKNRDWAGIKYYVNNRIVALKRKMIR